MRVLIADNGGAVCEDLRQSLANYPDTEVIGRARNADDLLSLAPELQPDVVLLAIDGFDSAGLALISTLHSMHLLTRIVVLTAYSHNNEYGRALLGAGAHGYLHTAAPLADVINALHAVASGGLYLPANVMALLSAEQKNGDHLTVREMQVLDLVARGYGNAAIARTLGITRRTVEFHLDNVYTKLHVRSRAAAAYVARQMGWLK
jgi:DNA-binding NarL/FixJ family response regulator